MMKITEPSLLINKKQVISNIDKMISRAKEFHSDLRPHFKTHQSAEIGELFRERGINKITVSSVSMAEYFASKGWDDITIAFPLNLLQLDKINKLAEKIQLNILVDSKYSILSLSTYLTHSIGIFIKIDTGYHRSGLSFENEEIEEIIQQIEKNDLLIFKGFLSHAGNTYNAKGKNEIETIVENSLVQLKTLKQRYSNSIISWGDTPSCSISENLKDFDELRPGNFVYYDVMQYHLGACKMEDIAVVVACPIVSVYPEREEMIIYGGAVHLSKEFIAADNNFKLFGYLCKIKDGKWTKPINGSWVSSLSQEHGIIKMPKDKIIEFQPGDIIGILPIHSCLSANLLKSNTFII